MEKHIGIIGLIQRNNRRFYNIPHLGWGIFTLIAAVVSGSAQQYKSIVSSTKKSITAWDVRVFDDEDVAELNKVYTFTDSVRLASVEVKCAAPGEIHPSIDGSIDVNVTAGLANGTSKQLVSCSNYDNYYYTRWPDHKPNDLDRDPPTTAYASGMPLDNVNKLTLAIDPTVHGEGGDHIDGRVLVTVEYYASTMGWK